jgi:phosphoribosylanthranilate isomerase
MHKKMNRPLVQIYEIQTPDEARQMIELGVDHIGSVLTSLADRHDPVIRETISAVRQKGAVSSLIPLYSEPEAVFDTLAFHRPDIVHFCDRLDSANPAVQKAIELQADVKRKFPRIRIMRSIPIGRQGAADLENVLQLAAKLEPVSDLFLTDTVMGGQAGSPDKDQPVEGFVGITGLTCDWQVAASLVTASRIPVILAGGVSPENVAAGIGQVRPHGVDSCTCTNAVDGSGNPIRFQKDAKRVKQLVSEVHQAAANVYCR